MPNRCKNTIQMKGIGKKEELFTKDEFDFNKLIPMPESLKVEAGSHQDEAIFVYLTDMVKTTPENLDDSTKELLKTLVFPFDNWEMLKSRMENLKLKDLQTLYEEGKVYVDNYKTYGAPTWYEWRCQNWGTKWNSSCTKVISDDEIEFDTAWYIPVPVLIALSKQNPGVEIHGEFQNEGGTEGSYMIKDGTITDIEIKEWQWEEKTE